MSRREPRASAAGAAQKDALHEFEQFKKKFLLANKHITKLNSSLSTRCQELETLVATLNSENLRLHATMLSLHAELKREREKTIHAMAALERTTMHALVQTFGNIRTELNIPPPPPKPTSPGRSPPKVRRPDPSLSPHANRLAQAPNFSQIAEEDEEGMEGNASPTPSPQLHRRRKSGGRSSGSSSSSGPLTSATRPASTQPQPLASLLPAPQIVTAIHVDIDDTLLAPSTRKRIARRQSGLIGTPAPAPSIHSLTPPRPPSPAFGSPLRRAAGLAEEEEENGVQDRDVPDAEADVEEQLARAAAAKKEKRRRLKALSVQAGETEGESESARERDRDRKERDRDREKEKERRRSRHEADEQGQGRTALPPLEIPSIPLSIQSRRYSTPEDSDVPTSAFTTSTRPTLTTPGTTPGPSHLPTPRTSSPPPIPHDPSPEPDLPAGGRERRVRRSVNYAEPKLNTKMRKPDPPPEAQPRRSSTAAPRSSVASRASSSAVTDDVNVTVKRKRSRPQLPVNEDSDEGGDDDDGAQADEEYMPSRDWAGGITRRRSTQASSSRRAGSGVEERRHSTLI
ncbi:unnamed protein product [Peniophora sp. CBMAI 1063]|nr:unnamed protein product [Peniophora sp. CBMAI 1063]